MLALGRAIIAGPRMLLLDEPSLGLAPRVVAQILGVLRAPRRLRAHRAARRAERPSALAIADRGVVMSLGEVVAARPARRPALRRPCVTPTWGSDHGPTSLSPRHRLARGAVFALFALALVLIWRRPHRQLRAGRDGGRGGLRRLPVTAFTGSYWAGLAAALVAGAVLGTSSSGG